MPRLLLILFALTLSACASTSSERAGRDDRPLVILVGVDGFRPDYLDRGVTPTLSRLRAEGAFAAMRPSFPSVTFPNHYTLVTGLHPDRVAADFDALLQDIATMEEPHASIAAA